MRIWLLFATVTALAADVTVNVDRPGKPIIIWEDTAATGQPVATAGVAGIRLGNRLLSGSRFTLDPERLCRWDYDMGCRMIPAEWYGRDRAESRELAASRYPFNKLINDPVEPIAQIWVARPQLRIGLHPRVPPWAYPLDFGPDFEVVGLIWRPGESLDDGTGTAGSATWEGADKDGRYVLRLRAQTAGDPVRPIGERSMDLAALRAQGQHQALYLPLPNVRQPFTVSLALSAGGQGWYCGGSLSAWLRYVGDAPWPELAAGDNAIPATRADDGATTVTAHIPRRQPYPGLVGDVGVRAHGCRLERVTPVLPGDGVENGDGYLRLTAPAGNPSWSLSLDMTDDQQDWRNIRAIRITYRVPTWCGRIQASARTPAYLSLGAPEAIRASTFPIQHWVTHEKQLPGDGEDRGAVRTLVLSPWGPTWEVDTTREMRPWTIEIGAVDLIPFAPGEREALAAERASRAAWDAATEASPLAQRLDAMPLPTGPHVNPRDLLLRGFWCVPVNQGYPWREQAGVSNNWEWIQYVVADLKAHNLNAVQFEVPYLSEKTMERWTKYAHEQGLRLWGCYSFLPFLPREDTPIEHRWDWWERLMKNWRPVAEKYHACPTYVAWAPGEEPAPWMVPFMQNFRQIAAEVGAQPQIMIYNSPTTMTEDVRTEPLPGGVAYDFYMFITVGVPKSRYIGVCEAAHQAAKQCGGVAWITPQMIGAQSGHHPTYLDMSRADMRFQVWVAIAFNIKGFFPWMYTNGAKTPDLKDTTYYGYYADEMGRLARIEKLVVEMERDDELELLEAPGDDWLVGNFADRADASWRFAVVVNLDLENTRTFVPKPVRAGDVVVRLEAGDDGPTVTPVAADAPVSVDPGNGHIYFVGDAARVAALATRYRNQ